MPLWKFQIWGKFWPKNDCPKIGIFEKLHFLPTKNMFLETMESLTDILFTFNYFLNFHNDIWQPFCNFIFFLNILKCQSTFSPWDCPFVSRWRHGDRFHLYYIFLHIIYMLKKKLPSNICNLLNNGGILSRLTIPSTL